MARSWTIGCLRLFHFLPSSRAASIANSNFKATYHDYVLAFRGLAVTLGAFWDDAYQTAFQEMHKHLCNHQTGLGYSFEYLEALTNDMLARIAAAARDPHTAVLLPGAAETVVPLKFGPRSGQRHS
jgi:hypothetical protein